MLPGTRRLNRIVALQGPRGQRGQRGQRGDPGPPPVHRWVGTCLQFANPDGSWGTAVDLQGAQGPPVAVRTDRGKILQRLADLEAATGLGLDKYLEGD